MTVTPKEIDLIFKLADTSGEGAITFDEWRNLFENIVRDSIRENELIETTELDWAKAIMIQIDNELRTNKILLIEFYNKLDKDDNGAVSLTEFKKFMLELDIDLVIFF